MIKLIYFSTFFGTSSELFFKTHYENKTKDRALLQTEVFVLEIKILKLGMKKLGKLN